MGTHPIISITCMYILSIHNTSFLCKIQILELKKWYRNVQYRSIVCIIKYDPIPTLKSSWMCNRWAGSAALAMGVSLLPWEGFYLLTNLENCHRGVIKPFFKGVTPWPPPLCPPMICKRWNAREDFVTRDVVLFMGWMEWQQFKYVRKDKQLS